MPIWIGETWKCLECGFAFTALFLLCAWLCALGIDRGLKDTSLATQCTVIAWNDVCDPMPVDRMTTCGRVTYDACGVAFLPELWPIFARMWTCELRGGDYLYCLDEAHR